MNSDSGTDFKALCIKFNNTINDRKFNESEDTIKTIKKLYPKEVSIIRYYKTVLEYYKDFNKSLRSFDELFLSNDFDRHTAEGYFFSQD